MTKTTFTCDRCGNSWEIINPDDPQRWKIELYAECMSGPRSTYRAPWSKSHKAEWCRPCMIAMGLLPPCEVPPTEKPSDAKPTMEDFTREIIREEIEAAKNA